MAKLIIYLIIAIAILLFALQNIEPVIIDFIFMAPVPVPMILVIALSFFSGFVVALFSVARITMKKKNKAQIEYHPK
ncbi:LapA family protein [Candidatus Terasakiella magnetica]|uniref:LapA family protein n=1 Tax=Candidatus Terasakiella magnetica TaxID=1867952 RepID=UPI000840F252|nr:LapA family protein [Candidatus Terasakiella magnetica]